MSTVARRCVGGNAMAVSSTPAPSPSSAKELIRARHLTSSIELRVVKEPNDPPDQPSNGRRAVPLPVVQRHFVNAELTGYIFLSQSQIQPPLSNAVAEGPELSRIGRSERLLCLEPHMAKRQRGDARAATSAIRSTIAFAGPWAWSVTSPAFRGPCSTASTSIWRCLP